MKSGFIAFVGKPNVGKSSLINALVGEKVSIVSPKPQTTRDRILGILNTDEYQMIFVDTPGIHKPGNKLGEYMEKCVRSSTVDVDAIVVVIDAQKGIGDTELEFIGKYLATDANVFVVVNKTDLVGDERLFPMLSRLTPYMQAAEGRNKIKEVIPTSCKKRRNIDTLRSILAMQLHDDVAYFARDEYTDKSERYMICEIVREKALLLLQDELPHGIGVSIAEMTCTPKLAKIDVDIVCEKASHKQIVIGEGGAMLRRIGMDARRDIERMLGCKAYIKLFVKVRENWRNKASVLSDLGFDGK